MREVNLFRHAADELYANKNAGPKARVFVAHGARWLGDDLRRLHQRRHGDGSKQNESGGECCKLGHFFSLWRLVTRFAAFVMEMPPRRGLDASADYFLAAPAQGAHANLRGALTGDGKGADLVGPRLPGLTAAGGFGGSGGDQIRL